MMHGRATFFDKAFGFSEPGSYNECRQIFHQAMSVRPDFLDKRPIVSFRLPRVSKQASSSSSASTTNMMPITQAGSFYTPSVKDLRSETLALFHLYEQEFKRTFPAATSASAAASTSPPSESSSASASSAPSQTQRVSVKLSHLAGDVTRLLVATTGTGTAGRNSPTSSSSSRVRSRSGGKTATTAPAAQQDIVYDDDDQHNKLILRDYRGLPMIGGAVFQAASQFNCLEMVSPGVSPERGIEGYEFDNTQGPKCAMACAAGIVYRNYMVPFTSPEVSTIPPSFASVVAGLGASSGSGSSSSSQDKKEEEEAPAVGHMAPPPMESQQQPGVPMPSVTSLVKDSSDNSTNTAMDLTTADDEPAAVDITSIDVRRLGQLRDRQINCFTDVAALLNAEILGKAGDTDGGGGKGGDNKTMFTMQNGYLDVKSAKFLKSIHDVLLDPAQSVLRNNILAALRIGVHRDSEVTSSPLFTSKIQQQQQKTKQKQTDADAQTPSHIITQTYNSAIGVAYSKLRHTTADSTWAPLATLVLSASYEATLLVSVQNNLRRRILLLRQQQQQSSASPPASAAYSPVATMLSSIDMPCYLTALGGGVFGNDLSWIAAGILEGKRNVEHLFATAAAASTSAAPPVVLDAQLVHYRQVDSQLQSAMAVLARAKK